MVYEVDRPLSLTMAQLDEPLHIPPISAIPKVLHSSLVMFLQIFPLEI